MNHKFSKNSVKNKKNGLYPSTRSSGIKGPVIWDCYKLGETSSY